MAKSMDREIPKLYMLFTNCDACRKLSGIKILATLVIGGEMLKNRKILFFQLSCSLTQSLSYHLNSVQYFCTKWIG